MKNIFVLLLILLTMNCFADDANFYGTWSIDKPIFIKGRLGDINEVYKTIKDFNFSFTANEFILNMNTIIQQPYYDKEIWDKNMLFNMTKGSAVKPVTFEDLEIPTEKETIISISIKESANKKYSGSSLVPGLFFFVIDKATIILIWRGQYFHMKRI